MKKATTLSLASLMVLGATTLAACSSSQSSNTSSYSYAYTTDPTSLDYILMNRATTSDVTGNFIDGLLEYNSKGELAPSLAKSWEVSEDGLTYTYKLREDAKWYTADGEEYAGVTAHDFVTGLKHAADAGAEGLYLVEDSIKGLSAYVKGESKDFSSVGIKAVDDYTLEYKLNQPEPYWNSKTTNGILWPVNKEFLESKGEKFGEPSADSILYNGPYFLTSWTSKSTLEYTKNDQYYDADNVHIEKVKLSYWSGSASDQENLVKNFSEGVYSAARVYPASSNYAKVEKQYKDNIVYSPQDGTSYYYTFNIGRTNYSNSAKKTDAQKESTKKAILNKDFRQAMNFAYNRLSYSAQSNGEEAANKNLRNLLVPPTFVKTDSATFGELVEKDIVQYGDEWKDMNFDDAQDAFYNVEKAKAEFAKAKETLQAEGVEFPIHLDIPVDQSSDATVKSTASFKESIETVLGKENIVIDMQMMSTDDFNNVTYFATSPDQLDFDLTGRGWGPDYQDPSTYLDIFNPSNGGQTIYFGFEAGKGGEAVAATGLDTLEKLNTEAGAEVKDVNARYEKYAAAQAWLIDSSLVLPNQSLGGIPKLTKQVPFTQSFSYGMGSKQGLYKYIELQEQPVTTKEYEEAQKKWEKDVRK